MELFVFTNNLFSEHVLYRGTSKIPLFFKIVLRLNQVQTKGELILHIFHISVTRMIEAGITGLSTVKNLGGDDESSVALAIFSLGKGATESSDNI